MVILKSKIDMETKGSTKTRLTGGYVLTVDDNRQKLWGGQVWHK